MLLKDDYRATLSLAVQMVQYYSWPLWRSAILLFNFCLTLLMPNSCPYWADKTDTVLGFSRLTVEIVIRISACCLYGDYVHMKSRVLIQHSRTFFRGKRKKRRSPLCLRYWEIDDEIPVGVVALTALAETSRFSFPFPSKARFNLQLSIFCAGLEILGQPLPNYTHVGVLSCQIFRNIWVFKIFSRVTGCCCCLKKHQRIIFL